MKTVESILTTFSIVVLALMSACSVESDQPEPTYLVKKIELSETIPVLSDIRPLPIEVSGKVVDLMRLGDLLWVSFDRTENILAAYDINTSSWKFELFNQGIGPNEYYLAEFIEPCINDSLFKFHDMLNKKIVTLNQAQLNRREESDYVEVQEEFLSGIFNMMGYPSFSQGQFDVFFAGSLLTDSARVIEFKSGEPLRAMGSYPAPYADWPEQPEGFAPLTALAFGGPIVGHPTQDKVVACQNTLDQIDLYHDGELYAKIVGDETIQPKFQVFEEEPGIYNLIMANDVVATFANVHATNEYFTAVYVGKEITATHVGPTTFLVFNWDGDMVKQFQIPFPAYNCTFFEDDAGKYILYAYNESDGLLYEASIDL